MNDVNAKQPGIRVVMIRLPKIINELLKRRLEASTGITLVDSIDDEDIFFPMFLENVDILILGATQAYPPQTIVRDLLKIAPKLRILVLQVTDNMMAEYWLGLRYLITHATDSYDSIRTVQALYARDVMEE